MMTDGLGIGVEDILQEENSAGLGLRGLRCGVSRFKEVREKRAYHIIF